MEVITKYNINDKVWLIIDNQAVSANITRVIISVESTDSCTVSYSLNYGSTEYSEDQLFSTKEDLLKSL